MFKSFSKNFFKPKNVPLTKSEPVKKCPKSDNIECDPSNIECR